MPPTDPPPDIPAHLRLSLVGPDSIRSWSFGEVTTGDLFDADDGSPVAGGLHCPAIFGVETDTSCACGRLSGAAHSGMRCSHCGTRPPAVSVKTFTAS